MFDYLEIAIDSAIESGAKYSDARILISKSRNIAAKNGEIENFNDSVDKIRDDVERLQQRTSIFYEKNT